MAVLLAATSAAPSAPAMELSIPAGKIDQVRLETCGLEAVHWAFLDQNMSDGIFVDGTKKFGHVRVDGYALHWNAGVWAFISNPTDALTGRLTIVLGYVDPTADKNSQEIPLKINGMRQILMHCLRRPGS